MFVPSCFKGRRYAATRLTPSPFPSSHTTRLGGAGGATACTFFTYVFLVIPFFFAFHAYHLSQILRVTSVWARLVSTVLWDGTEDLLRLPLRPQLMSVFEECSTNLAYTIIYQKCL